MELSKAPNKMVQDKLGWIKMDQDGPKGAKIKVSLTDIHYTLHMAK